MDRTRIQTSMQNITNELAAGAAVLHDALDLLRDPYQLYLRSPEATRRELNQALNHHFYCNDDGQVTAALRFDDLHRAAIQQAQTKRPLLPSTGFTTSPKITRRSGLAGDSAGCPNFWSSPGRSFLTSGRNKRSVVGPTYPHTNRVLAAASKAIQL
ncbi:MAG: hypothetical protein M3Y42_09880 [Actinomycetota bacterium]|nr:hypothetical protein [Actinomycetota bacterium]MDQ2957261.1 hypothetical protein [Actinomycetota bacterium]